jgi:hypothetical protein
MTHLRRTGTTVRAKGLLTEYDFSNQRRNYSKQIRNINKNVINILSKTLAEKGCSTIVDSTSRSFPHSWLITGFVTRLTRRVSLGVRVNLSLVLYECFVGRCLSFRTFSFGHCVCLFSKILIC